MSRVEAGNQICQSERYLSPLEGIVGICETRQLNCRKMTGLCLLLCLSDENVHAVIAMLSCLRK